MSDSPDSKPSGLRALFGRKRKRLSNPNPTVPAKATSDGPTQQDGKPNNRQIYRPRHADRDMVLSMPVASRPDLVAKAREARRQSVCSEIGFNTSLQPVAGAQTQRTHPLFVHPKLHTHFYAAANAPRSTSMSVAPSSAGWSRGSAPPRSVSSPAGLLEQYSMSAQNDAQSLSMSNSHNRLSWRSEAGKSIPPSSHTGVHAVDYAMRKLDLEETESSLDTQFVEPTTLAPRTWDGTFHPSMAATSSTAPPRAYFSHNGSIPNLRAIQGKGKGKAVEGNIYYQGDPDPTRTIEDPDSHLIHTRPTAGSRPMGSAVGIQAPPSENSTNDSLESRGSRWTYRWTWTGSPSSASLRTVVTANTEYTVNEQEVATWPKVDFPDGFEDFKDEDTDTATVKGNPEIAQTNDDATDSETVDEYFDAEEPEVVEAQWATAKRASLVSDASGMNDQGA